MNPVDVLSRMWWVGIGTYIDLFSCGAGGNQLGQYVCRARGPGNSYEVYAVNSLIYVRPIPMARGPLKEASRFPCVGIGNPQ